MAVVPAPEYGYTVVYLPPGEFTGLEKKTLDAAYFIEEGALTIFKDRTHQAVYAIRTDMVLMVERGARVVTV